VNLRTYIDTSGESGGVPEALNVGLAQDRSRVRSHVVAAGPLADHTDVLRSRKQLEDYSGDARERVYVRRIADLARAGGAFAGDDGTVRTLLDVVVAAEAHEHLCEIYNTFLPLIVLYQNHCPHTTIFEFIQNGRKKFCNYYFGLSRASKLIIPPSIIMYNFIITMLIISSFSSYFFIIFKFLAYIVNINTFLIGGSNIFFQ